MRENKQKNELTTFAIYDHPDDFPDDFVVRKWLSNMHGAFPCEHTLHKTLEEARTAIPRGLTCLGRNLLDDPKIVEVWI